MGFNADAIFLEKDKDTLEFCNGINDKNNIKEIIDSHEGIKDKFTHHFQKLQEWWNGVAKDIERFHGHNNLWEFRNKAMANLKSKLIPFGIFDEFKIAGIFVNWWEDLLYDFKTVASSGWSSMLIEDEGIEKKFFADDLKNIEELESKISELEGELNEILEEVEDGDEEDQEQKTAKKVKDYLKEIVKDLHSSGQEYAIKEAKKWEELIEKIEVKDKELKKLNKELKSIKQDLENKVTQKRNSLTEQEAKELLLEKFFDTIKQYLEKYLNNEKRELVKIFENLWDKYKISLKQLKSERDLDGNKLDWFLNKLGYINK